MPKSSEGKNSINKSKNELAEDAALDELVEHSSDFLLQIWLLIDKMLPEQLALTNVGGPKIVRATGQPILSKMLYTNYMMFLCVSTSLNEKGSLTMSELSRVIAVPVSTATRMVDWMVENQYAERLTDPGDRRIVRVALTHDGLTLSKEIKKFLFEHVAGFIKDLPEEQRKHLLANTKEVINVWTSAVEGSKLPLV